MAACSAGTTSVQTYQSCEAPAFGGIPYNANDPNTAAIQAAVNASIPSGISNKVAYKVACEAMLRAGVLFYQKSTPGDCGAPSPAPGGISNGQIIGLSGTAASGATSALAAAGVLSGPATLGIGTAISLAVAGLEDLFAHHAQAVANEQATLCRVMNFFNPAKQAIDAGVRSGQITPDAGATLLIQLVNQAKTGLSTILKSCNAACWYNGYLVAFSNFSRTWYDSIAPTSGVYAQAPGGPPTYYGTPPGGVTTSPSMLPPPPPTRSLPYNTYAPALGSAPILMTNKNLPGNTYAPDYLNQGYNQQTGASAQLADVPNTFALTPTNLFLIIAAVILLLLVAG